jgi:hypothetical protein
MEEMAGDDGRWRRWLVMTAASDGGGRGEEMQRWWKLTGGSRLPVREKSLCSPLVLLPNMSG